MGVHGLWRLIEPSGKPVPLETLENKVLGVDVSIWLHQAVKGFQDAKGAPLPNAHLLGIYHRVCKLLYFKIKPVFIFDGGVPVLKKQTIAKRNQQKSRNTSEAERLQKQLLNTLLKHTAISKVLSEKTKASIISPPKKTQRHDDMYALPPSEIDSTLSSDEETSEHTTSDTTDSSPTKHWDLHTIDMSSKNFKLLPVDIRHEILTELKETRKQNSWGRLHELPKQSDDFSVYQMGRLLKRQAVQAALEDAEKEMGGHSLSLAELESLLQDHGVKTTNDNLGKRIASDENTRYLLIKDVKTAMEKARKEQLKLDALSEEKGSETGEKEEETGNCDGIEAEEATKGTISENNIKTKADKEFEEDLETAIALSLQEEPSTSGSSSLSNFNSNDGKRKLNFSFLENFDDGDFDSDSSEEMVEVPSKTTLSSAQNYMVEYSGLTPSEIAKIIGEKRGKSLKKGKIKKLSKAVVPPHEEIGYSIEIVSDESHESENITEIDGKSKDNASEVMKSNSISNDFDKIIESPKKDLVKTNENTDDVEVMSDSGESSSSKEFLEVSEAKTTQSSLEIVIDPSDNVDDGEDLFSDVFTTSADSPKKESLEIVIQPASKLDDDLFSDIFEEKPSVPEEKVETDKSENKKVVFETLSKDEDTSTKNEDKVFKEQIKEAVSENKEIISEPPKTEGTKVETKETIEKKEKAERPKLSLDQMRGLKDDLQREKVDLIVEKSTKERLATNITDQMYQEAQELLELFGVPYVVAPMEAEAQCAFLDEIELTDGTITDDSDIWLFGGRTVYKNFFNQSKFVMEFKSEDIKHHFKLTREQMILLALLVGSDYTTGIQGVGPVTALEILAAFPPLQSQQFSLTQHQLVSGLKEFRSWFHKGQSGGPGRSVLKSKLKNISFTDNFPSLQVVEAYLDPKVETSKDKFSWGKPDVVGLTDFAKEKFGWTTKKAEEILKPVIKKLEESRMQKSIKDFFKTKHKVHSVDAEGRMSKRVKTAIDRMGKTPEELIAAEMEALDKEKEKMSKKKKNIKVINKKKDNSSVYSTEHKGETVKPVQKRARRKETRKTEKSKDTSGKDDSIVTESKRKAEDQGEEKKPKPKRSRKKNEENTANELPTNGSSLEKAETEETLNENDLEQFQNIAAQLRKRRERKEELSKIPKQKQTKPPPKTPAMEVIPEGLEDDEEIQFLKATTSISLKRVEEINREVKDDIDKSTKKPSLRNTFHKKEVIHQKLRDKTDLLRNKMRAIEVFRKSKKGPGYIEKRVRRRRGPNEDAGLSESSSDE